MRYVFGTRKMCLTKDYFGTPGWNLSKRLRWRNRNLSRLFGHLRIKSSMTPLSIKRLWEPLPYCCHKFPLNELQFEGISAQWSDNQALIVWYQQIWRTISPMDEDGVSHPKHYLLIVDSILLGSDSSHILYYIIIPNHQCAYSQHFHGYILSFAEILWVLSWVNRVM